MGRGHFDGHKLHFVVAAPLEFTRADEANWRALLKQTSQALHRATLAQIQFGNVFLADKMPAIPDAKAVLINDSTGISTGTNGGFDETGTGQ